MKPSRFVQQPQSYCIPSSTSAEYEFDMSFNPHAQKRERHFLHCVADYVTIPSTTKTFGPVTRNTKGDFDSCFACGGKIPEGCLIRLWHRDPTERYFASTVGADDACLTYLNTLREETEAKEGRQLDLRPPLLSRSSSPNPASSTIVSGGSSRPQDTFAARTRKGERAQISPDAPTDPSANTGADDIWARKSWRRKETPSVQDVPPRVPSRVAVGSNWRIQGHSTPTSDSRASDEAARFADIISQPSWRSGNLALERPEGSATASPLSPWDKNWRQDTHVPTSNHGVDIIYSTRSTTRTGLTASTENDISPDKQAIIRAKFDEALKLTIGESRLASAAADVDRLVA
ncbi:hypothetical protein P7C73_g6340, partial [Tremellales sp. Uapishka_1]